MKRRFSPVVLLAILLVPSPTRAEVPPPSSGRKVRLIVRGDDLGALHGINVASKEAFTHGIMTVAHVIVPGPWFPEAVRILKAHPEVDVGIHLAITSEWSSVKWRPLTRAPSLVDEDGYFRPFIWPNQAMPGASHREAGTWKLEEIEAELRAQIELLKRHLPRVSNGGCHMGCGSLDPKVKELIDRLLAEYGLRPETAALEPLPVQWPKGTPPGRLTVAQRVAALAKALETAEPGDYQMVEHPATDDPEMRAISHPGYEDVAKDRAAVLALWTHPRIKAVIKRRGIELIGFRDLAKTP